MASVRKLKRELNDIMGEVIETAMVWERANPDKDHSEAEAIISDAIDAFDSLIVKIHNSESELEQRARMREVRREMISKGESLVDRVGKL